LNNLRLQLPDGHAKVKIAKAGFLSLWREPLADAPWRRLDFSGASLYAGRMAMSVQDRSRQILIHGLALVMAGLLWGFVVPHTPYPRLALDAHIELVSNGLLIIVLAALLLKLPHQVGPKSVAIMLLSVWLIWPMALSEVANAWWGTTQILPIAAHEAGATGGAAWQELMVKLTHIIGGLGLVVAWALLIAGFLKKPVASPTGV
jgi:(hydroxyamino)benzene mutase